MNHEFSDLISLLLDSFKRTGYDPKAVWRFYLYLKGDVRRARRLKKLRRGRKWPETRRRNTERTQKCKSCGSYGVTDGYPTCCVCGTDNQWFLQMGLNGKEDEK